MIKDSSLKCLKNPPTPNPQENKKDSPRWAKDLTTHFTKEEIQTANKHTKMARLHWQSGNCKLTSQ